VSLSARVQGDRERVWPTADELREKASNARRVRRIGWPGIPLYVRLGRVTIDSDEAEYVASMIEWAERLEQEALAVIAAKPSQEALADPLWSACRSLAEVLGSKP
jgi:hypothetical protein